MDVCNLGKGDLDQLDKIVKGVLRREGFHGRQSSDERLYSKRKEGGRELKRFNPFPVFVPVCVPGGKNVPKLKFRRFL